VLTTLSIHNFLVIDNLEIDFDEALNIITGETGTGKTIIIDALKLLLGDRVDRGFFRDTNKTIIIEALFSKIRNLMPKEFCEIFNIESEVYIRREITYNGRNKIYINNRFATLKDLKTLSKNLIEISGQYENQKLLDKEYHLLYLDGLVDKSYLEKYKNCYDKFVSINKKYAQLIDEKRIFEKNRDYLLFQKNELESANINLTEDIMLDEKIRKLTNIEEIKKEIVALLDYLKFGEININSLTSLSLKKLENLKAIYNDLNEYYDKIYDLFLSCDEVSKKLEKILNEIDIEQTNIDELVQRKFLLEQLKRKYKRDIKGLISLREELSNSLESYYLKDEQLKEIEEDLFVAKNDLLKIAEDLSIERKKVALELEKRIMLLFEDVGLKGGVFNVIFNKLVDYTTRGIDDVEFYIATNPGFDAMPINKIASGGELSRILLSLKEIFSEFEGKETIVFDEIDMGISGITAKKVALKLKSLSNKKQLIIITHLPVIAAVGTKHYHLIKRDYAGKALTDIIELSKEKREQVLATMIAGNVTESSIDQAKELLRT
jgi:DNA repair protein RecN (Recombination protein N)